MPNLPPAAADRDRQPDRPPVVSLMLPKGGVGKTTSAVNLGAELARMGARVLVVDADAQGHAAASLGLDVGPDVPTFADALTDPAQTAEAIQAARGYGEDGEPTGTDKLPSSEPHGRLDLIPGGPALAVALRDLARTEYGAEWRTARALATVEDGYDVVLIDSAPGWDALAVASLFASSHVVCPVALDALALRALGAFLPRIAELRAHRRSTGAPDGPRLAAFLPTFLDGRVKAPAEILAHLKTAADRHPDAPAVLPPIRYSARLAEAPAFGETAREIEPEGRGAEDYAAAAAALADAIGAARLSRSIGSPAP